MAYSVLELGLHAASQDVTLITPGRLDSVLHDPPPERSRHTIGRPRVVGKRLPSLENVLHDLKRFGTSSPWTGMAKGNGR